MLQDISKRLQVSGSRGTPSVIDAISQCLIFDPDMAEAHYSLFRIYHGVGKAELAASHIAAFKQPRGANRGDEQIQQLLFTVDK